MKKSAFLITIDTEGDNLWQKNSISTKNAHFLPRFQALCEKYGFKPTWLTNYEMATDPVYIEFARDVIQRQQGEVGMHLHAWHSPPEYTLTDNDWQHKPYLIEYPEVIMRQKIQVMTQILEDTFQTKMLSHRAGRWAFNAFYARTLIELGYKVDCSVTPRVNWCDSPGSPGGTGGTDYHHFPDYAYWLDENDISSPDGSSALLEVPMSIQYKYLPWVNNLRKWSDCLRGKHHSAKVSWLRPCGGNVESMKKVTEQTLASGSDYIEFMLHSSELMPGGSPTFKNTAETEQLYDDLEQLFEWLAVRATGMTLTDYYQYFRIKA
ncbi:deacetylase [Enterobacteriaceae bacterium LUAb1]